MNVATPLGRITRAEHERRERAREVRNNRLTDLESVLTDLEAAHNTAELLSDDDDLADEIDKLAAKVRNRFQAVETGHV